MVAPGGTWTVKAVTVSGNNSSRNVKKITLSAAMKPIWSTMGDFSSLAYQLNMNRHTLVQ